MYWLPVSAYYYFYCFVYISNESSANVFFDNLQVQHDRGRIIEENHYYAHGLKIAAISSKAYGAPNNNYGYQVDFSEMDDDLGWNDFELRSFDPQIGRFLQNDPYDQLASGYVGMGNDAVNNIDPSGGWAAIGIFVGPGFGCAATAGMVGYGGIMSNAISISSTTMAIAGMAMNAISLTESGARLVENEKLLGAGMRRGFVCWLPVSSCYYLLHCLHQQRKQCKCVL